MAVPAIIIAAYTLRCLLYCFCPDLWGGFMMSRREYKHKMADKLAGGRSTTVIEDHAIVKSIFEDDPDFTVLIL